MACLELKIQSPTRRVSACVDHEGRISGHRGCAKKRFTATSELKSLTAGPSTLILIRVSKVRSPSRDLWSVLIRRIELNPRSTLALLTGSRRRISMGNTGDFSSRFIPTLSSGSTCLQAHSKTFKHCIAVFCDKYLTLFCTL